MTDYLFLAKADGSKGEPWTRDPKTLELFLRAARVCNIVKPYKKADGKRYIDTPPIRKYIFEGKERDRSEN